MSKLNLKYVEEAIEQDFDIFEKFEHKERAVREESFKDVRRKERKVKNQTKYGAWDE